MFQVPEALRNDMNLLFDKYSKFGILIGDVEKEKIDHPQSICNLIVYQISYYMSAYAYSHDVHLNNITDENGGVDIETLLKFPRLAQMNLTCDQVKQAIIDTNCQYLELVDDHKVSYYYRLVSF